MYEAASKFEEIGAGLSFGPNAQEALRLLGLSDALKACSGTTLRDEIWYGANMSSAGNDVLLRIRFPFRIGQSGHPSNGKVFAEVN